jgi:hypothetical protein
MTAATPSMVTEVSATLVERMILRRGAAADGAVLLGGGEVAVEGEQVDAMALGELGAGVLGAADFSGTGEEDEHIPIEAVGVEALDAGEHLGIEVAVIGGGEVLDGDVEAAALGAQGGAVVEVGADGGGLERGGHDTSLRSGRGPCWRRRRRARRYRRRGGARGIRRGRRRPRRGRVGVGEERRPRTPSVTKERRVLGPADVLERTW